MADPTEREEKGAIALVDRIMEGAENIVYWAVALLLVACAALALATIGYHLVKDLEEGTSNAIVTAVDGLLLVFILVELLGAVRATLAERKLVAEPFLIVGIIASIKEIVVAALKASKAEGGAFDDAMTEVAVLGGVVLLLALSSFLVRRKEREPAEE